ncbi:Mpo1-like protein [Nostoc sp. C117]|uniref:Mpo1-like protein n=1 Tax=Nostoc sp. C117 TaxID=3349875 RepID=UPI00370D98F5
MNKQKFNNFSDFYLFYLSQHTNSICKLLHVVGQIFSLIVLAVIIKTNSWIYLPSTVFIGYGFAWIGHFFFEKNKPATFTYPILSFLSDFIMTKDIIFGKIKF